MELQLQFKIDEYQTLLAEVRENATDSRLVRSLVKEAEWTESGARELVYLARQYGTFYLSNALALAFAMGIEDGREG